MRFLLYLILAQFPTLLYGQTTRDVVVATGKTINSVRARHNLPPVRLNIQMSIEAQRYANRMAYEHFFRHSGMPYGEIIAWGQSSPQVVVDDWYHSPGHRAIMLGNYRECGLGFAVGTLHGQRRTYWIATFR